MNKQKFILDSYQKLKGKQTLKEISLDTGIQITRVFRILNGAPMKLHEYLVFEEKVKEVRGSIYELEGLLKDCEQFLSHTELSNIVTGLKRQIQKVKYRTCS